MRDFLKKGKCIDMREQMNKNVDKEVFKRTASSTKAINLGARIYRGGTRL